MAAFDRDLDRRRFLALMSASAALAAAGCGRFDDRGDIVPYARQPEGEIPGIPRYYASMLRSVPGAPPVVATTREGRVVKLEGNADHPASRGALGAFGQAATYSLYDPDRIRAPHDRRGPTTWSRVDRAVTAALAEASRRGSAVIVFTPAIVSPTERAVVDAFRAACPTARFVAAESFHDAEVVDGWRRAVGYAAGPAIDWRAADVVVGFEPDFLDGSAATQRGWFDRRDPDVARDMARMWAIEGAPTLTGTNADHRLAVRPARQPRLLLAMLRETIVTLGLGPLARDPDLRRALEPFALDAEAREAGLEPAVAGALITDLVTHPGHGAVVAGALLPASAHVLAAALNATLSNVGAVVTARRRVEPTISAEADVESAVDAMNAGSVAVVLDLEANPRYQLSYRRDFDRALGRVPLVVSASTVVNETGATAHFVVPTAHDLESWGDADLHDDVLSLQQPAMRPLYAGRQREDLLLNWMPGRPAAAYRDFLRARWQREVLPAVGAAADFAVFWRGALENGFIPWRVPAAASEPAISPAAVLDAVRVCATPAATGVDVILAPSPHVFDGRFANNGWLQELPHPVTSQVWGNGALVGVAAAQRLGCADGDLLAVSLGDRRVELPAIVEPGAAADVVRIELGHGRTDAGRIGTAVGVNAAVLLAGATDARVSRWIRSGASISRAGAWSGIVRSQRYPRSEKRPLAVEGTLAEYRLDPRFVHERIREGGNVPSPGGWTYTTGQKWAMVIDLGRCSGCGACAAACSAENNVPVVGADQVRRERQMQWIRVDRYYDRADDRARATRQPVMCQHCDNAPCENVCPVAATVHTVDGLNQMTYNRCVGTRYCANNCPYKVRRFNFLDYHATLASPEELRMNTEVTVRSRGVMEKCTFCVQRLRAAQRAARREGRPLVDGEARPACAQACPAGAIAFGDLNDPKSRVRALVDNARGYRLLGSLGVNPSVIYLAKMRHPYPGIPA